MESSSKQFKKITSMKKNPSSFSENGDNIPLYLGASALFISVCASVFFYRELRNMKREIGDVKQIKNQISNIDVRFDAIDNKFEEIIENLNKPPPTIQQSPSIQVKNKEPKNTFVIPNEDKEQDSDSDSDSVESIELQES